MSLTSKRVRVPTATHRTLARMHEPRASYPSSFFDSIHQALVTRGVISDSFQDRRAASSKPSATSPACERTRAFFVVEASTANGSEMAFFMEQLRAYYCASRGEDWWEEASYGFHLLCVCATFQTPVALRGGSNGCYNSCLHIARCCAALLNARNATFIDTADWLAMGRDAALIVSAAVMANAAEETLPVTSADAGHAAVRVAPSIFAHSHFDFQDGFLKEFDQRWRPRAGVERVACCFGTHSATTIVCVLLL